MKSFSTAFKRVYEKGLMKYGFKKVKGKQPYYVRCIGNEIVHVIAFQNMYSLSQFHKVFVVLFGVATVYRKEILFNFPPKFNQQWLKELSTICYKENYYPAHDAKAYEEMIPREFVYAIADENAMMAEITKSFALTEKYAIPILDKVTTLEACINHFFKYSSILLILSEISDAYVQGLIGRDDNEGLLSTRIYGREAFENGWQRVFEEVDAEELYRMNAGLNKLTIEQHRENVMEHQKDLKEMLNIFDILQNTPEWQEKIRKELEQRKNNNIAILRECGFEI